MNDDDKVRECFVIVFVPTDSLDLCMLRWWEKWTALEVIKGQYYKIFHLFTILYHICKRIIYIKRLQYSVYCDVLVTISAEIKWNLIRQNIGRVISPGIPVPFV